MRRVCSLPEGPIPISRDCAGRFFVGRRMVTGPLAQVVFGPAGRDGGGAGEG